jgi:transposase
MEFPDDIQALKQLLAAVLLRLAGLEAENAALKAENAALKTENEELRRRLNLGSHNSHKPPASDGLRKKPALPKPPGRASGGQPGHAGDTLRAVPDPDEVVLHHATHCRCCQRRFSAADVTRIVTQRQVFDLPAPKLEVTEHQLGEIVCCGERHYGELPPEVTQPAQYGPQIKALSVLLNTDYRLPLEKVEQLLSDLYGCRFNESTVVAAQQECATRLAPVAEEIKAGLAASAVVHSDETGLRVAGQLHWCHVAATSLWTYLFVHEKRGPAALWSAESVLPQLRGWLVHDCWGSYFGFAQCRHALCNAHLLRELEAQKENGRKWAEAMQELLLELYEASGQGAGVAENRAEWERRYEAVLAAGEAEEPPPERGARGRPKNSVGRNLLNRLRKHMGGVLAFGFVAEVPFTNNQAERDLRSVKVKQKVAQCFRTLAGAQRYARIQSFISTVRKHEQNVYQALVQVFRRQVFSFQTAK